jgi:hypothetical protein
MKREGLDKSYMICKQKIKNFKSYYFVKEFDYCVNTLAKKMDNMGQIEFQKLLGKIEVLGELIIKHK